MTFQNFCIFFHIFHIPNQHEYYLLNISVDTTLSEQDFTWQIQEKFACICLKVKMLLTIRNILLAIRISKIHVSILNLIFTLQMFMLINMGLNWKPLLSLGISRSVSLLFLCLSWIQHPELFCEGVNKGKLTLTVRFVFWIFQRRFQLYRCFFPSHSLCTWRLQPKENCLYRNEVLIRCFSGELTTQIPLQDRSNS